MEPTETAGDGAGRTPRWPLLAVVLLGAGMVLSLLVVHRDENDGAVYIVIARHLLRDGTPFHLRYLSEDLPVFHEHPPLWIWVQAAAMALAPGLDPSLLGALCAMATLAVAFWLGADLLGPRAAFLGCALLGLTDSFFRWSPTGKLDPPLVLLFTASVALLVRSRGRAWMLAAGGLAAGLGVLVKGPPALGAPVVGALLLALTGRTAPLRSARCWALVAGAALLPAAIFFGYDRLALGGEWWRGYVDGQLLASIDGRRADARGHLYLVRSLVGRALPALPLAAIAMLRPRAARVGLLLWAAVVVVAFSAASRAYWWYALPAFVPLSLLAGAALEDLLALARLERVADRLVPVAAALGALLLGALPLRLAARVERPCRFGTLAERARQRTPPDGTLGLVSTPRDWRGQAILAEHADRDVVVRDRLDALPERARLALWLDSGEPSPGWAIVAAEGPVRLVARTGPPEKVSR